jgi:hypothetical protein
MKAFSENKKVERREHICLPKEGFAKGNAFIALEAELGQRLEDEMKA